MSQRLVSLIIPIYNSEAFLEKCLSSAVSQTLGEIEIILVDDGSSDGSFAIIDSFAENDPRIKVFKQQNKGPGAARNLGLRMASGEFVAFMDSDDWIDEEFLEKMYNAAVENDADVVMCNHKKVINDSLTLPLPKHSLPKTPGFRKIMKNAVSDTGIRGYVWDKLYRRAIFEENGIEYPEGLYYEDLATTFKLFYYSRKTVFLKESLYFYLQRPNSITKKIDPKPIFDRIEALDIMKSFLAEKDILLEFAFEFQYLCLKMWFANLFCLAVIYTLQGKRGFLRDAARVTKQSLSLASLKFSGLGEASERKRLLTRV